MKTIFDLLKEHHFFHDFEPEYINTIAGCGKNMVFKKDTFIFNEDQPANHFYIIRQGKVAIQIATSEQGNIVIQTLQEGDVLGFSWIIPPYFWRFDAKVLETAHVVALDAKCLREKCQKDTQMGYELIKLFASVLAERLEMTQLQLLDMYDVKTT